jgi:hypothetical protein
MIITPSQIDNAVKLLKQEADGSPSNQQARHKARQLIAAHCDKLAEFANRKPTSKAADYLYGYIRELEGL